MSPNKPNNKIIRSHGSPIVEHEGIAFQYTILQIFASSQWFDMQMLHPKFLHFRLYTRICQLMAQAAAAAGAAAVRASAAILAQAALRRGGSPSQPLVVLAVGPLRASGFRRGVAFGWAVCRVRRTMLSVAGCLTVARSVTETRQRRADPRGSGPQPEKRTQRKKRRYRGLRQSCGFLSFAVPKTQNNLIGKVGRTGAKF